jgi:hypothetical protein
MMHIQMMFHQVFMEKTQCGREQANPAQRHRSQMEQVLPAGARRSQEPGRPRQPGRGEIQHRQGAGAKGGRRRDERPSDLTLIQAGGAALRRPRYFSLRF